MNTLPLTLHLPILAGMVSAFATTAHSQDLADHAKSGDLGIYYEVHGDLGAGATPFLVLHGGMGSIDGDFGDRGWGWSDEELSSIEVPALIVLGDRDFMNVNHAARMAELVGAQLAVLPDTTHLSIMKRADWLAPLIVNRIATANE